MKRTLITRLERLEAAQHDATAPYFELIQLDREGFIGIAPARVGRGPIPVIVMPTAPESPVTRESPMMEPHDQPTAQTTDQASFDFNAMKNDGVSSSMFR